MLLWLTFWWPCPCGVAWVNKESSGLKASTECAERCKHRRCPHVISFPSLVCQHPPSPNKCLQPLLIIKQLGPIKSWHCIYFSTCLSWLSPSEAGHLCPNSTPIFFRYVAFNIFFVVFHSNDITHVTPVNCGNVKAWLPLHLPLNHKSNYECMEWWWVKKQKYYFWCSLAKTC